MKIIHAVLCLVLGAVWAQTGFAAEKFLADRHAERGIKCEVCHDPSAPTKMKEDANRHEACVQCHGFYDAVVKRTQPKDPDEQNPHSQHDGNLPCSTCHKGHKPGVNYCGQCHMWSFKVP